MKKIALVAVAAFFTALLSSCGPMWPWNGGGDGPGHHGGGPGGGGFEHHGGGPGGGGFEYHGGGHHGGHHGPEEGH